MLREKVDAALVNYLSRGEGVGEAPHYEVERRDWVPDHDNQRAVDPDTIAHRGPVLHPPVTVYADGQPVIYHGMMPDHSNGPPLDRQIYQALLRVPVAKSGMVGDPVWARFKSANFGTLAPSPRVGRLAPTFAALERDHPGTCHALHRLFHLGWAMTMKEAGGLWAELLKHADGHVQSPHAAWRLDGSIWTSGQIYDTAALPYHRDDSRSSVPGSGVCIWNFRHRSLQGGMLHFPELNVTLAQPPGSVVVFNGADLYHGVTPLKRRQSAQRRFAVLAYCKRGLELSPKDALRQAQLDRTNKELARA